MLAQADEFSKLIELEVHAFQKARHRFPNNGVSNFTGNAARAQNDVPAGGICPGRKHRRRGSSLTLAWGGSLFLNWPVLPVIVVVWTLSAVNPSGPAALHIKDSPRSPGRTSRRSVFLVSSRCGLIESSSSHG